MIEHSKCDGQCCEFDKSMAHSPTQLSYILHYESLLQFIVLYCIIALICYKADDNYKLSL